MPASLDTHRGFIFIMLHTLLESGQIHVYNSDMHTPIEDSLLISQILHNSRHCTSLLFDGQFYLELMQFDSVQMSCLDYRDAQSWTLCDVSEGMESCSGHQSANGCWLQVSSGT